MINLVVCLFSVILTIISVAIFVNFVFTGKVISVFNVFFKSKNEELNKYKNNHYYNNFNNLINQEIFTFILLNGSNFLLIPFDINKVFYLIMTYINLIFVITIAIISVKLAKNNNIYYNNKIKNILKLDINKYSDIKDKAQFVHNILLIKKEYCYLYTHGKVNVFNNTFDKLKYIDKNVNNSLNDKNKDDELLDEETISSLANKLNELIIISNNIQTK